MCREHVLKIQELIRQKATEHKVIQVYVSQAANDHTLSIHTVHGSLAYEDMKPWLMTELEVLDKAAQEDVPVVWNYMFRENGRKARREEMVAQCSEALLQE